MQVHYKLIRVISILASEHQLDTSLGSYITQTGLANVSVSGNSASTSIGQVVPEPKIPVDVTMFAMSLSLGTFSLVQTTNESVTNSRILTIVGSISSIGYTVTGQSLTSSIGSVSITGTANIDVSGIGLTANIGSVNVTAWSRDQSWCK